MKRIAQVALLALLLTGCAGEKGIIDRDGYQLDTRHPAQAAYPRIKVLVIHYTADNFDVSLAAEALKDMIAPDDSHKVTPELVLDVVSDHFNVSVSELKGSRRNARTAGARQIVMYLCRQMTDASLQSIGDLLGGRDHSTVNHGVDKIARDVEKDETLRNTIEIIQKKISPL